MLKSVFKKITHALLMPVAILIVLWEQLVYRPIKWLSAYLEKNKVVHKIADKVRNANPYVALLILACCGLPLIPFKIAGLYLVGHGYTLLGFGTFGLAKIVGGAISVQIFNLTEPAIRKISMINTGLTWFFDKKNKIKQLITEMPAMIAVKAHTQQIKYMVKDFVVNTVAYQKVKNAMTPKTTTQPVMVVVVEDSMTAIPEVSLYQKMKMRHKKYVAYWGTE